MTQPFEAQLTTCLQSVQSTDKATRDEAEAYIQRIQEENWAAFIQGLTQELINDGRPEVSRQMAGLLLKNALDAKDSLVQVRVLLKQRTRQCQPPSASNADGPTTCVCCRHKRRRSGELSMRTRRGRSVMACSALLRVR